MDMECRRGRNWDIEECPPDKWKEGRVNIQDCPETGPQPIRQAEKIRRIFLCVQGKRQLLTGRKAARAGLTVEAAFVVPLFLLAMAAVISLLDIYRIQAEVKTSLSESARELGMYAYAADTGSDSPVGGAVSTAVCALYGRQKLPDLGENVQVTLARSSYKGGVITLTADIFYTLPVTFGPVKTLHLVNTASAGVWVGDTKEKWTGNSGGSEEMVYITENESVYHTSASCTHIHLSIHVGSKDAVENLRNEYGERYQSCAKCRGDANGGTVYYSDKGNCYHSSAACSGLKRTVKLVKKSEVSGKQMCQRCQAREG